MEIWKKLREPFPAEEIEWRIQSSGSLDNGEKWVMIVPYVDSRAIMNRLDDVVGPENWRDQYRPASSLDIPGLICRLSIRVNDEWISKEDGADARSQKAGEPMKFKGLLSDALKRTAVKFGIGRELYDLEPVYVGGLDIKPGRPPRDSNGIRLYVKGKINGWCDRPNVNGNKPATKKTKKNTTEDPEDATKGQYNAIKMLSESKDLSNNPDLEARVDDFLNSDVREYAVAAKLINELNEMPNGTKTESIKKRLAKSNV